MAGQALYAKCARKEYIVKATVQDAVSAAGIEGGRVFVFVDDHIEADTQGQTGANGEFAGRFFFDTFRKSSIFGDQCDRVPETLEVLISKDGYRGIRKRVSSKDLGTDESAIFQFGRINLPPLPR